MARTKVPFTFTILSSAARTATTTSGVFVNSEGYRGVRIYIDATDSAATPSVVFTVEVRDPIGGDWKTLTGATSTAVTGATTGPNFLDIYPGCVAVANEVVNRAIGKSFRVVATAGDADSLTYSVGGEWLP